jgi:hypothetical protein
VRVVSTINVPIGTAVPSSQEDPSALTKEGMARSSNTIIKAARFIYIPQFNVGGIL